MTMLQTSDVTTKVLFRSVGMNIIKINIIKVKRITFDHSLFTFFSPIVHQHFRLCAATEVFCKDMKCIPVSALG